MAPIPAASAAGRRRLPAAVLASLALVVLTVQPAGAQTPQVVMRGLAFVPATVQVQQVAGEPGFPEPHGHAVWTNEDPGTEHTVTFDDPRLAPSGPLATRRRHEVVFSLVGSFTYRCTIHPSMTGTVEVLAAPGTPAAAGEGKGGDGGPGGATVLLVGAGVAVVAVLAWLLIRRRRPDERQVP